MQYRATFSAIVGGVESAALAFGPLISGAIANYSSWRVSFWVIVPAGMATIALVFLSVDDLRRSENAHLSSKDVLKRIDWAGFSINVPMILCLVLGLQLAGTASWTDWRVIVLLVVAVVLLLLFLIVEHRAGDNSLSLIHI